MFLVLPVQTVLLFCALGASSYSLFTMLVTASPLEFQLLSTILHIASITLSVYGAFQQGESSCQCKCSSLSEDQETQGHRVVEEVDGGLRVTTQITEEELRELLDQTVPEETVVEETTEFADLLDSTNKKEN